MNPRHAGTSSSLWLLGGSVVFLGVVSGSGERVLSLLANTFWLALSVALISTCVGTLLALLLTRTDLPLRRVGQVLLLTLVFTPLYLQAAGWDAGFGRQGWYSYISGSLATPVLSGWRAAVWIHTLAAIPWATLIVAVGFRWIEPELEEQALLDGSPWQVCWHVTLPLARPAILAAFLWVMVSTAGEMTVTDMYQVRTYAEEIYTTFALGEDAGLSAMQQLRLNFAMLGLLIVCMLACASHWTTSRVEFFGRPPLTFSLGAARWPCLAVVALLLGVAVGVPLANLVYNAGVRVEQIGTTRTRTWAFAKLVSILAEVPHRYRMELWWSAVIGALGATTSLVGALPLAWWGRHSGWRKWPALLVAMLALATPGPLLGLGVIWLLNRDHPAWLADLYDHSVLAPVLAVAIRVLPLVILVLWFSLRTIPQGLLEAATMDGAGPAKRWLLVVLPNRIPAILAAWLMGFTLALGDLAASILVLPPSTPTLAFSIFQLAHAGVDDRLAGLCLLSVAVFSGLTAMATGLLVGWGSRPVRAG